MFGLRNLTDAQPRAKKGQPHHSTIGVARANSSQVPARGVNRCAPAVPCATSRRQPGERRAARWSRSAASCRVIRDSLPAPVVDRLRLQRHAANRTCTRPITNDLGMHWAGPLGPGRGHGDVGLQRHTALGTGSGPRLPYLGIHGTHVRCDAMVRPWSCSAPRHPRR